MHKRPLLLLFSVVFMDMVGFGFIIPLIPDYIKHFGGGPALVGFLMSSYALGQFFAAPIVGRLSDRYGRKPLLLFSIGGTFLSLLLLGFAWALPVLFISRALDGLTGGNITVAQSYIADMTTRENRAKGMGMIGMAFGLGFIAGPLFGGILVGFGFAVPAFAAAGIAFLNLILITFLLPESLTPEKSALVKDNPRRKFSFSLLWEALSSEHAGRILNIVLFYGLAFTMFETIFSLFAQERLGLDARSRSFLLAYVGLLVALVQGGGIGILTKRFKETHLLFAASLMLAVSLVLWGLSSGIIYLMLVLIPLSLAAGVLGTMNRSLLSKSVCPEEVGGIMGLGASLESLVRIIAPALGGILFSKVGFWVPGFLGGLIMAWVALYSFRRLIKNPPPPLVE